MVRSHRGPAGKFFILSDWNHSDGPLRDGIDGTPVAANRLKAIRRQIPARRRHPARPLGGWRTRDHPPHFRPRHRLVPRLLPDYTWSNLGDADVLLPAVQRIIAAGSDRFDASYLAAIGSDAAAPPCPAKPAAASMTSARPDPANAHEAGIHRLGERLLALNRPPQEDAPEILARESLDAALDGTNYTLLDQAGQADDPPLPRCLARLPHRRCCFS
jgi:hypothetical protein